MDQTRQYIHKSHSQKGPPRAHTFHGLILSAIAVLLALHMGLLAMTPGAAVRADGLDPFIPQSQFQHAAYFEQVPPGNYSLDFQVEPSQNSVDPRNWFNNVGAAGRNDIGQALAQIMSLFMVAEAYVTRVVLELLGWCYHLPIVPEVTRALTPLFNGIVGQFYFTLLDFWLIVRAGHIGYLMLRGRSAASFNKFVVLILLVLLDTALIARPADALLSADAVVNQTSGAILSTINDHLPPQWDQQNGHSYTPSQPISDPAEHAIAVTGGAIWDLAVTETWCAAEVGSGLSSRPCQEATQTLLTEDPGQRAASSTFVQGCVALPDDPSQHFSCLQFGNLGERFLVVLIGALNTLLLVGFLAFLAIVLLALKVGMDIWWLLGAFVIGFNIAPQIGERVTLSWLRRMGDLLVGVLVVGTILAVVLIVARTVLAAAASAGPLGQMLAWTAVMAFVMWRRDLWMPLVFGATAQAVRGTAGLRQEGYTSRAPIVIGGYSASELTGNRIWVTRSMTSSRSPLDRGHPLIARSSRFADATARPEWVAGGAIAPATGFAGQAGDGNHTRDLSERKHVEDQLTRYDTSASPGHQRSGIHRSSYQPLHPSPDLATQEYLSTVEHSRSGAEGQASWHANPELARLHGPAQRTSAGQLDLRDILRRRAALIEQRRLSLPPSRPEPEPVVIERRPVAGMPHWTSSSSTTQP